MNKIIFALMECRTIDEVNKIVDSNFELFVFDTYLAQFVCTVKNRIQRIEAEKAKSWSLAQMN